MTACAAPATSYYHAIGYRPPHNLKRGGRRDPCRRLNCPGTPPRALREGSVGFRHERDPETREARPRPGSGPRGAPVRLGNEGEGVQRVRGGPPGHRQEHGRPALRARRRTSAAHASGLGLRLVLWSPVRAPCPPPPATAGEGVPP